MAALNPIFREFLSTFVSCRVRFLVVGGHALAVHGRPRYTEDIDVWIDPTPLNAKRVVKALATFGYAAYAAHEREFRTPERMTHIGTPPLRIDIMTSIDGVRFAEAWPRSVKATVDGLTIRFIGRQDLIANKIASARAKDLADLELLGEISEPRKKPGPQSGRPKRASTTKRLHKPKAKRS